MKKIIIHSCSEDFLWYKDLVGYSFDVEWCDRTHQYYTEDEKYFFTYLGMKPDKLYFWNCDIIEAADTIVNIGLERFKFV